MKPKGVGFKDPVWEFLDPVTNFWLAYDDSTQTIIERAYHAGEDSVILSHGVFAKDTFTVILKDNATGHPKQINNVTKNQRSVRRNLVGTLATWFFS